MTARSSRTRSPRTWHGDERGTAARRRCRARGPAPRSAAHELVELELLEVALGRVLAGELDEVADERGQLAQLRQQVLAQLRALLGRQLGRAREQLDVGLHGRQRRAQLVRRVGDQLALRTARLGERVEHRVEAARQAGQLVVADRLDAPGEVLRRRDVARAAHQPADRPQRAAADEAAEQRGQADAGEARRRRAPPRAGASCVDLFERARRLQRLALGEAGDVHAHLRRRTARSRRRTARRGPGPTATTRGPAASRAGWPSGGWMPPGAGDDLGVAGLLAERRGRQQQQEAAAPLLVEVQRGAAALGSSDGQRRGVDAARRASAARRRPSRAAARGRTRT